MYGSGCVRVSVETRRGKQKDKKGGEQRTEKWYIGRHNFSSFSQYMLYEKAVEEKSTCRRFTSLSPGLLSQPPASVNSKTQTPSCCSGKEKSKRGKEGKEGSLDLYVSWKDPHERAGKKQKDDA